MPSLFSVVHFLDELLSIRALPDVSNNGLQVEGAPDIAKIGFSVDACAETFERAVAEGCSMLVVHHGISWGDSLSAVTGVTSRRLAFLLRHGLSLYAAHLPLDRHGDYGNNVQLFRMLGLQHTQPFGYQSGVPLSLMGTLPQATHVADIMQALERRLKHKPCLWSFGGKRVRCVALMSGSGASFLPEAIAKGADVFVTGEVQHSSYHLAKEGRINVIAAGHYATETLGLHALMRVVQEKFNIPTVFIEADTGL